MKKIAPVLFVLILMLAQPAMAKSCYSSAEAEAEQGIRIHSELMVIGLNCQGMRFTDGTNLYLKYHEFTKQHAKLLGAYEDRLIAFFRERGDPNPVGTLNTMRTNFANKISYDAAKMQPHAFCNRYASRITKVQGMDSGTLRKWASTFYPSHPVSMPVCASAR